MKISCEIIKDLLPLYHDNVCSDDTCILVEEHIVECDSCKKELENIHKEFKYPQIEVDEKKTIKAIASAWKKDKARAFLKGTVIAVVMCTLLMGVYYSLTIWKIIPVSSDLLEVSDVSQLSDGRIAYHLDVKDDRNLYFTKFTLKDDGSFYVTPMRSLIESKGYLKSVPYNGYQMLDIAESNAYEERYGRGIELTSFYIGPKDDGILIWEKDMELPPASEELEKMFGLNN